MQFPDPLLSMQKRRILTILKFLVLNIFQFGDTHILQYECPYDIQQCSYLCSISKKMFFLRVILFRKKFKVFWLMSFGCVIQFSNYCFQIRDYQEFSSGV